MLNVVAKRRKLLPTCTPQPGMAAMAMLILAGFLPSTSSGQAMRKQPVSTYPTAALFSLTFSSGDKRKPVLEALIHGERVGLTFAEKAPQPTLRPSAGVADGPCLDFAKVAGNGETFSAPVVRDPRLAKGLAGAQTLTVTGWFRVEPMYDDHGHDYVLNSPWLSFFFHERGKDGTALRLNGEKGSTVLWSTSNGQFVSGDRWVFYAFTYDGRQTKNNCLSYTGSEMDPVQLAWTASAAIGPLKTAPEGDMIVGAANARGEFAYTGFLGPLRIYASKDGQPSAVLDPAQLEQIRQSDLGSDWPKKLAARQQREAEKQAAKLESLRRKYYSDALNVVATDPLDPVFPDRLARPMQLVDHPMSAARGGSAVWQFVILGTRPGPCTIRTTLPVNNAGQTLHCTMKTFVIRPVPVEANTNGGSRTAIGRRPPDSWMRHFTREAPFEVAEVALQADEMVLSPERCQAVVLVLDVATDATPGDYRGTAQFTAAGSGITRPFKVRVHDVVLPETANALNVSYWLSPDPRDLTTGPPPEWWSNEHWRLLDNTARTLQWYGQDCILTPVIKGEHALVRTTRRKDGQYTFDFTRFDRWVELFQRHGFKQFHGHHVTQWGAVYGMDEATGRKTVLIPSRSDTQFLPFLGEFFRALGQHLGQKQWTRSYLQHLMDETSDVATYRKLADLLRAEAPGIRTIDAVNHKPKELSAIVDVPVLAVVYLEREATLVSARRKEGLKTWFYNCCSPPPPYPNRHLDEPLSNSRLYPWIAFRFGVTGYLNWGGNIYRGADPYKTSVGPVPNGSQNPGHPPGDNWHFYPTRDGLVGGMRMLAFRQGLQDYRLLSLLAAKDTRRADAIATQMVHTLRQYAHHAVAFHASRTELLHRLESATRR